MKYIVLSLAMLAFPVFATSSPEPWTIGYLFDAISGFFNDVLWFFFEYIPDLLDRFKHWLIYYFLYLYITTKIYAVELAFATAQLLLSDLGLVAAMESMANKLPNDLRVFLVKVNFFKALNLLIEAYVARFVYRLAGAF